MRVSRPGATEERLRNEHTRGTNTRRRASTTAQSQPASQARAAYRLIELPSEPPSDMPRELRASLFMSGAMLCRARPCCGAASDCLEFAELPSPASEGREERMASRAAAPAFK